MTAHTDVLTSRPAAAAGRPAGVLTALAILFAALLAASGTGPLSVAVLPFVAAILFALLGQAVPWLWLLVAFSGVGLTWVEGSVSLGAWDINIPGLQWGFTFLMGLLLLVLLPRTGEKWPLLFRAYAVFIGVAALWVLRSPSLFHAVKHVVQYATPLVFGLVVLRVARDATSVRWLRGSLWASFAIAAVVGVASLAWSETSGSHAGLQGALGNRTFALFLIPIYALALAAWRVRGPAYALIAAGAFLLIVLTLSRTVLAVCVGLLGIAFLWRASWRTRITGVLLAAAAGALLLTMEPIRERMFDPDTLRSGRLTDVGVEGTGRSAQLSLGGISTSGRGLLWLQTWRHAVQSPLTGHGTGSAEAYLATELQFVTALPHNDYLRVFHDSGVVGLVVLIAMGAVGLVWLRRLQLRSRTRLGQELGLAAFMTWLAYLLVAVTDNILVYTSFFTQNMFLLIGLAWIVIEQEQQAAEPVQA